MRFPPNAWFYFVFLLLAGGSVARAQVSSDACSLNAANEYPVTTTCVPLDFDKPGSYNANYNPGGCNAGNQDDAYAWFTGTGNMTWVEYTPPAGADGILHVLDGCAGNVLGCSNVNGAGGTETVMLPTTLGVQYIVRVQRYNSNNAMNNGTLCIHSPAYDCICRLTLNDSYGDGWGDAGGQAYVEILVNGVSYGLWTLNNGTSGYVDFGVAAGDNVQVVYNTTGLGWYIGENSMDLTVNGQCVYTTYAPPNLGLPYAITADCNPPASAAPQDCAGGVTICGNADIVNNSTHTGCSLDLNASNTGCLLADERQGTWYYFSPSTSGTIGFTITPNGNIDYDFALWGPFSSAQCPTGAPLRCSFANGLFTPTYTTGMTNGAGDNTEDENGDGWVNDLNVTAGQVYALYVDNFSASGQDFTLTWNLTNGASLDCTPLPVELLDLRATARDPVIDVSWATATEQNSDFFEVQRSADGQHFAPIGNVPAAGDAQYRNDYLFTDQAPLPGANYYRLDQVDRDGASHLTKIVVAFLGDGGQRPVLFPNPVGDVLNVFFNAPMDGTALFSIQDALGRTVMRSGATVVHGQRTEQLPLDRLAPGWYNVRINLPGGQVLQGGGFLKK